jgi:hypothetical protein
MAKFYIEYVNGVFGATGLDREDLPTDALKARGLLRLEPSASPMIDLNQTSAFVYEVRDDTVYMNWTVTDKTGDELAMAKAHKWAQIRGDRRNRLEQSDYTQMLDVPLTSEMRAKWLAYRQQLRDITTQSDPFTVVWPTQPE